MKMKKGSVLIFLMMCILWLTACQPEETQSSPSEKEKDDQKDVMVNILPADGFIENVGWLSSSEILSVREEDGVTTFYIYNVYDGSNQKIYDVQPSYVSASISSDKKKILIHSSPASYKAQLTIIDRSGEVQFQKDVPSYDLTHSWSPFNDDTVVMTTFNEDWSFQVFEIKIGDGTMDPIDVEQPFVQWQSASSVLYQDWSKDEVSVSAPLVAQNILDGEKEMIVEDSIHFNQFKSSLLSVFSREEKGPFTYQFIHSNGEVQSEFTVDLLSRYSDWLIPYYDMIEGTGRLITFIANEPGSFDTYSGTFSLKEWDTDSGKEEVLFDDLPLEPIKCSPDGESCLYGNQLEKVINFKNSSIVQLLKEEGADI
ncbi:hypothetical protein [Rossellomorea sp. KS-H15a]|uniref:YqgU-like beta propeller domain-containing protein n=1 Tax=Rossellomorea sp. KS-H15a TaxID=2963940 RepID=UPI0020C6B41C|nr:hypothetical protein [Rossellomorea sp. KS-H15a]UTE76326.1 hypothetical protein M1J35_17345 [Rossellomorea sp. KS-H15a]